MGFIDKAIPLTEEETRRQQIIERLKFLQASLVSVKSGKDEPKVADVAETVSALIKVSSDLSALAQTYREAVGNALIAWLSTQPSAEEVQRVETKITENTGVKMVVEDTSPFQVRFPATARLENMVREFLSDNVLPYRFSIGDKGDYSLIVGMPPIATPEMLMEALTKIVQTMSTDAFGYVAMIAPYFDPAGHDYLGK